MSAAVVNRSSSLSQAAPGILGWNEDGGGSAERKLLENPRDELFASENPVWLLPERFDVIDRRSCGIFREFAVAIELIEGCRESCEGTLGEGGLCIATDALEMWEWEVVDILSSSFGARFSAALLVARRNRLDIVELIDVCVRREGDLMRLVLWFEVEGVGASASARSTHSTI